MSAEIMENQYWGIPKSALVTSFLLHLSIPLMLVSVKILDKMGIHLFPDRKIVMDAYQSFIQVDVVALPDQLVNDKSALDASLPTVENPKTVVEDAPKVETKDDTMVDEQDKAEKEKAKALKEKEAMTTKREKDKLEKKRVAEQEKAMKKMQEEAKREQALKSLSAKNGQKGRGKLKGNVLSQGTSAHGAIGTAKDRYTALLTEAIKQHFNIYMWQQKKNLLAEVQFEIFPTGRVRRRKVVKTSSDPTYDSAILKALDDSQPLPLPDDPLLLSEEFHITFKP